MEAANVVLITNVGQGYGRAVALAYGRANHDVVCADRDVELASKTAAEIEDQGGQAIPIQADMSTQMDVRNAFIKVQEIFGNLTGVVHVASHESNTPFNTLSDSEFAELQDENVKSSFLSLKAASRLLAPLWFVLVGPPTSASEPHMVSVRGAMQELATSLQERTDRLRINLIFPSRPASDPIHDARLSETALFLGSSQATGVSGQTFHVLLPPPPKVIEALLPEVRAALDESVRQDDLEATVYPLDDGEAEAGDSDVDSGEPFAEETTDPNPIDPALDIDSDGTLSEEDLDLAFDLDDRGSSF